MDWVRENWLWIALPILFGWLYMKMRDRNARGRHKLSSRKHGSHELGRPEDGGHGKRNGHCGHCDHSDENQSEDLSGSDVKIHVKR